MKLELINMFYSKLSDCLKMPKLVQGFEF